MKSILLAHARRYPKMEPRDAVKLIYQSTFGGGHLIRDEEACLTRLRQEYESTPQNTATPLLEDIGNGIVRVNLGALDAHGYSPEQLGRDFIRSAALVRGNRDDFLSRLGVLSGLTKEGQLPFSFDALSAYLTAYEASGFPPVSHSETYRNNYRPAYRVVAWRCLSEQYRLL